MTTQESLQHQFSEHGHHVRKRRRRGPIKRLGKWLERRGVRAEHLLILAGLIAGLMLILVVAMLVNQDLPGPRLGR